jgi:hypothetical protein
MNENNVENSGAVKNESNASLQKNLRRRAATKRYRDKHREEIAARDGHYYWQNRDRILEARRAHYPVHCEELKQKRRDRFAKEQQQRKELEQRATYLWNHPEMTRKQYDAVIRRKKRFEFQRSPEGRAELRREKERRLRKIERDMKERPFILERKMRLKEAAAGGIRWVASANVRDE